MATGLTKTALTRHLAEILMDRSINEALAGKNVNQL